MGCAHPFFRMTDERKAAQSRGALVGGGSVARAPDMVVREGTQGCAGALAGTLARSVG
jgi:hypothetical protein